jgi:glycosyltransferase involved in cell wall biosynthesis
MNSVSVIMATHNNQHQIGKAIASIILQEFSTFELIIVNDGSSDSTHEVIDLFRKRDPRIRVLNNNSCVGRAVARNRAVVEAKGELIAILDADDIAMPDRLSKQVSYMLEHPNIGMLGTWAYKIDNSCNLVGLFTSPTRETELRKRLKWAQMPFIHTSMMFRRDLMLRAGLYDERFPRSQDFFLCRKIVELSSSACMPEFLVAFSDYSLSNHELLRNRYRQYGHAAYHALRRYPNFFGYTNLLRILLLACLPGKTIKYLRNITKNENSMKIDEYETRRLRLWIDTLLISQPDDFSNYRSEFSNL